MANDIGPGELRRFAGKILKDEARGRRRLKRYGWEVLLAFARATLIGDTPAPTIDDQSDKDRRLSGAQRLCLEAIYHGSFDRQDFHPATIAALQKKGLVDAEDRLTTAGAAVINEG